MQIITIPIADSPNALAIPTTAPPRAVPALPRLRTAGTKAVDAGENRLSALARAIAGIEATPVEEPKPRPVPRPRVFFD